MDKEGIYIGNCNWYQREVLQSDFARRPPIGGDLLYGFKPNYFKYRLPNLNESLWRLHVNRSMVNDWVLTGQRDHDSH